MVRNIMAIALVSGVALAPFCAQAGNKFALKSVRVDLPTGDRTFPSEAGSDAVNNNCLACHSAGMVLNQPALSKAQWEAEVNKMRTAYKAPIDPNDINTIVDYLVSLSGNN